MTIRLLCCFALAAGAGLAQTQGTNPGGSAPHSAPAVQTPPAKSSPAKPPAQAGQKAPGTQQPKPGEAGSALAPTEPVITIHGLCTSTARPVAGKTADQKTTRATETKPCTTVVTKEEFDGVLDAISRPGQTIPPTARQGIAQSYVGLRALAEAARKAGVESSPKFKESMRLARLQKLAELYNREQEDKYRNLSAEEIEAYYQKNLPKYEEVKLHRIFIPKNNPSAQNKEEFEKKAQGVANEIRERAVKGEDPDQLEKEAYTALGLTAQPVKTDLGSRRRGLLPAQLEAAIFSLQPGEVGKVDEESSGYMIYRVDSKQTAPLDQVKNEISQDLFRQKMDSAIKGVTGAVHPEFNEKYFGPASAPTPTAPAGPAAPGGAKPPASAPAAPAAPVPGAAKPPAPAPGTGQPH